METAIIAAGNFIDPELKHHILCKIVKINGYIILLSNYMTH